MVELCKDVLNLNGLVKKRHEYQIVGWRAERPWPTVTLLLTSMNFKRFFFLFFLNLCCWQLQPGREQIFPALRSRVWIWINTRQITVNCDTSLIIAKSIVQQTLYFFEPCELSQWNKRIGQLLQSLRNSLLEIEWIEFFLIV